MSAKTCQLCGKPLGRRNSDGEFCSREHRTQFRLRRGMDRLEEANKVANIMRRRENLRPIPASELSAPGASDSKAWTSPLPFRVQQAEYRFPASRPLLFQVRVEGDHDRFSTPISNLSRRSSASADRLMAPTSLPRGARPAPLLPSRKPPVGNTGLERAELTQIECEKPGTKGKARECGAVLRPTRSRILPERRIEWQTPGSESLEKARRPQSITVKPVRAVDANARSYHRREFAKHTPIVRAGQRRLAQVPGLPDGKPQQGARAETRDVPAHSRSCVIEVSVAMPLVPQLRAGNAVSGTRQAGAARLCPAAFEAATPFHTRAASVTWEFASPVSLRQLRVDDMRKGTLSHASPLGLQTPLDAAQDCRPAEIRFTPADAPFDVAPMELHNVFPSGGADGGVPASEPVEEHFNTSLDHWTGDTVDWKLDAAGARPAGLALLKPTLSLGNYEFEFLTRIESRAVTFAFRAANVSNYFKVTISSLDAGRYELKRCGVIGGIEEPATTAPLPAVIRPGAAFTVKVRAWQNDFTVWLDGELAARWTDGRLPTGGIGFMAPRDDRARVYWVRLSQLEGPNSQAATHRPVRSIQ